MSQNSIKLMFGAAITAVAVLMTFIVTDFRLYQLATVASWSVAMLGLNLLTGYNGQISIGHATFMAIGGYVVAITVRDYGMSYPLTFILAFIICGVFGALLGIPALRLPGISLALITLAMSLAFPQVLKKTSSFTGGVQGLVTPTERQFNAPDWTGLTTTQFRYLTFVAVTAIVFLLVFNLVRGRWGLAMMSIRDNPISAASMGVNLARTKVITFGVSAGLAGVAGAMQSTLTGFMAPESFTIIVSIQLLTGIVIGGLGSVVGALIGGFFQVYLLNFANQISDALPGAVYGLVILLVMLFAPGGIVGIGRTIYAKYRAGQSPGNDSPPSESNDASNDLRPAVAGGVDP